MASKKLYPPSGITFDFKPSPKQYELWKLLQPECHICGGEIKQKLVGLDQMGNQRFHPFCTNCGNENVPQLILGGGAAGGGKSHILGMWLVSCCIRWPDFRALIARKTIKSLKESSWRSVLHILKLMNLKEDVNYQINNLSGSIRFWNGSILLMQEMADLPSDPQFERFGSLQVSAAGVDEASEISEKAITSHRSALFSPASRSRRGYGRPAEGRNRTSLSVGSGHRERLHFRCPNGRIYTGSFARFRRRIPG